MSMQNFNTKNNRQGRCAFCKHWYDPTNAAIRPKNIKAGMWEFDDKVENPCELTGYKRKSVMTCKDYVCKV